MYESSKMNRAKFKLKVPKIISPDKKDKTLSSDQLKTNFQLAGKAAKERKLTRKLIADSMGEGGYLSVNLVKDYNLCSNFNQTSIKLFNLTTLEKPPYQTTRETLKAITDNTNDQNLKKSAGYMLNLFEVKKEAKEGNIKIENRKLGDGSGLTRLANTLVKKHNWATIDIVKSAKFLIKNLKFNLFDKIVIDSKHIKEIRENAQKIISEPSLNNLEALIKTLKKSDSRYFTGNTIGRAFVIIAGNNCLGKAVEKIETANKNLNESYKTMKTFHNKYKEIQSAEQAFFDGNTLKLDILDDLINIFADDYNRESPPTKLKYKGLGKEAKKQLLDFIKSMHTKKTTGIKDVQPNNKQHILNVIKTMGKVRFPELPLKNAIINIYAQLQDNITKNIQPVLNVIFPGNE